MPSSVPEWPGVRCWRRALWCWVETKNSPTVKTFAHFSPFSILLFSPLRFQNPNQSILLFWSVTQPLHLHSVFLSFLNFQNHNINHNHNLQLQSSQFSVVFSLIFSIHTRFFFYLDACVRAGLGSRRVLIFRRRKILVKIRLLNQIKKKGFLL